METSTEAITISSTALPLVKVHPLVHMHVYNQHIRRKDGDNVSKVIGALLGNKNDQGIEVTDCFSLPSTAVLDIRNLDRHCDSLFTLHSKVYSREQIVGWYVSCDDGEPIMDWTSQIHDLFVRKCDKTGINPIHLVVDTASPTANLRTRAYIARRIKLGASNQDMATSYTQLEVELVASDTEKICLQHLIGGVKADAAQMLAETAPLVPGSVRPALLQAPLPTANEALVHSLQRLLSLVDGVHQYVGDVVEGRQAPNVDIGTSLADVVAELAPLDNQALEAFFTGKRRDLLMVEYLTSLTRTQVSIAEKLNAII